MSDYGISDRWNSASIPLRIIWIICFLIATICLSFALVKLVSSDLQRGPVQLETTVQLAPGPRPLPDVLFCPFNRLNRSFFQEHGVRQPTIEYILTLYNTTSKSDSGSTTTSHSIGKAYDDHLIHNLLQLQQAVGVHLMEDLIKVASLPCQSFVQYCASPSQGKFDCCATAQDEANTNCFRFSGGLQAYPGEDNGLRIVAKIPPASIVATGVTSAQTGGALIRLADPGSDPDPGVTFLPLQSHVLLSVRSKTFKIDQEINNQVIDNGCRSDTRPGFSMLICHDDCYFKVASDLCSCRLITSRSRNYHVCTPLQRDRCLITQAREHYRHSSNRAAIAQCNEGCLPPCTRRSFSAAVSFSPLLFPPFSGGNHSPAAEENEEDIEEEEIEQRIVVDIFYDSFDETVVRKARDTGLMVFLAHVGGLVALWFVFLWIVFNLKDIYKCMFSKSQHWSPERSRPYTASTTTTASAPHVEYTPIATDAYSLSTADVVCVELRLDDPEKSPFKRLSREFKFIDETRRKEQLLLTDPDTDTEIETAEPLKLEKCLT